MIRIDGKKVAGEIMVNLKKSGAPKKKLALISFEPTDSFGSFARQQLKVARELGVEMTVLFRAETKNTEELLAELKRVGDSDDVGGVVIQLPLPSRFNKQAVLSSIPAGKDVDCLNPATTAVFAPAVLTVNSVLEIVFPGPVCLPHNWSLPGQLCIAGAGTLIGKPLAKYLKHRFVGCRLLDSKSSPEEIAQALMWTDVVISGTGVPKLIDPGKMLKPDAILIDFGYPGDVDESGGLGKVGYYCPSKGGTGPILVASMFENFYRLNGSLK